MAVLAMLAVLAAPGDHIADRGCVYLGVHLGVYLGDHIADKG
jgi:hypothetical protein